MSRKSKAAEFIDEGYQVHVTGRHVLITDAIKDYAIEKISKIEKYNIRIIDIQIIMDVQKLEQRVDVIIKVGHIKMRASASDRDMYAAIDEVADKIATQLRKYKARMQDHHAKSLTAIDMNVNVYKAPAEAELEDINGEIDEANQEALINSYRPHEIVSTDKKLLKHLTAAEAILKLEVTGDIFLVYKSIEDNKLKVIYRRNDGHFGIIEPEA